MAAPRTSTAIALAALVIVGAALYSTNLQNQFFWDDDDLIVNNPYIHELSWDHVGKMFTEDLQGGSGQPSNYYRPLLLLGFGINHAISGLDPTGYHVVSNGFHVASGVLVFLLIAAATRNRIAGFVAAMLFVIHPLQTEAVTYLSGRGDPLHLFFMLLSLGTFYLAERRGVGWTTWHRPLSLLLLALAILSQEKAIVYPFLLAVFWVAFVARGGLLESVKQAAGKALPYFSVVFVYGVLRLTVLNFVNTLDFHTVPSLYSEQLYVRMFTFLHALLVYYRLMAVPVGLHMKRSVEIHLSFLDVEVWFSLLLLVAIAVWMAILLSRHSRRAAGSVTDFRIWLFGVGWFFVTLGPVSGITPINALIYEHWLYVGLIGPATIAGWYVARAYEALSRRDWKPAVAGLTIALVGYGSFLGVQTVRRNILWGKPLEFLEDILRYEPEDISVNNNLGSVYYDRGDLDRAEFHYGVAAMGQQISPEPRYNLGIIHEDRGQIERAVEQYEQALAIDPDFHHAMEKLIGVYTRQRDLAGFMRWIEELKRVRSQDPHVFFNAAVAYHSAGRADRALADALRARELAAADPGSEIALRIEGLLATLEP